MSARTAPLVCLLLVACGNGNTDGAGQDAQTEIELTSIGSVQGPGDASPVVGERVRVSGIVTGDFQDGDGDSGDLGGFYLQSVRADADARTSDGIFVYDAGGTGMDVSEGDRVEITGTVVEYFGETQVKPDQVTVTGSGTIEPLPIVLPATSTTTSTDGQTIADLEAWEGMLVRLPQELAVTDLYDLQRFGEVGLSADGRLFTFTNGRPPNVAGYAAHVESNNARRLTLDDGNRAQNVMPPRYIYSAGPEELALRTGDAIKGLIGVLRYSRGSGGDGNEGWRIEPIVAPEFERRNPRPGAPDVKGDIRIASFNVLNYFSTPDDAGEQCGPRGDIKCRGADTAEELERQRAKTVNAIALMNADVIALIELENNGDRALREITESLNQPGGAPEYDYIATGAVGDGAIRTGFIYRRASVDPVGDFAILDSDIDPRFRDRNRPALAQTFESTDGGRVTVVVNHFKSKGSSCANDGDPDRGDGQGNCNRTRTNAAIALADWLAEDPTGSGDPDVLIVGDLNAHVLEDPLTALKASGYVNLLERDGEGEPYSFVFRGNAGALDHALASLSLMPQVAATVEWHINADEAPVHDYNLEYGRDPALFDPTSPYRAADHDPVIIDLQLTP